MDESPSIGDSNHPADAPQQCEFGCDLKCLHCGYQARREGTRRNCSSNAPRPSLGTQLTGYAAAVSRWLAAGAPKRSDEEVDDLLAICQGEGTGTLADLGDTRNTQPALFVIESLLASQLQAQGRCPSVVVWVASCCLC